MMHHLQPVVKFYCVIEENIMNKSLSLLAFLIVIALPSYAGTLVFEAEEEEEIIISDEKRGVSSSATNNIRKPAATAKIQCKLADGTVVMLPPAECESRKVQARRARQ
jgi:hypothetical protein